MEQIVYADLYFLINFSMDFLCFFLTAKLLCVRFPFGRALLGAALGGLYANVALFLPLSPLPALLADMAVCALLCSVTFFRRTLWRQSLLTAPVFFAVSMVLGGVMTALFHLLNRLELPLGELEGDGLSVWAFAALAALSGIITYLSERFFRRRTAAKWATVCIQLLGREVTLSALCDSGNLLRDPMSGKPCIVSDADSLCALLPVSLCRAAKSHAPLPAALPDALRARIALIPTHTATGEALLIALRPDRVTVDGGHGPREVEALLALSSLASRADGAVALLPTELLL